MAASLPNVWHLRSVAEASSKSCYICYKPTTGVLITPDNKDFFYVCKTHLKDKGFANPLIDEKVEAEKRKKETMDAEIEKIKKEYEERQREKKAKKKSKDDKEKKKAEDEDDGKAEQERDDKIKAIQTGTKPNVEADDEPRIFALQRSFFQMRVDRIRNADLAKRNQHRMKDPTFFPTAPRGDIV